MRWTPDGRHTELVVATDPRHPGRPVLTDEDGEPRLVDDGKVISRQDFPLDHWTLGARESAALARLLADAEGLRPVGEVTDRLDRPGQAYVYDDHSGPRHMLILDPSTGAVLGLELTFTTDQPVYGARAGDVMQYSAWLR
ncbi:hypothetical protein GCM10010294_15820 [Streptomyces griseoloalbus]|nr:hypothetical protein GCM10010294_15820 [Streptomyces griseoloalbus]